jgi:fructose-bisphosphate aldolase, class II
MVTLHEVLKHAEMEGAAIGHFNVSDLVTLKAVFESASDQNVSFIVGVSEGERHFLGVRQIAAMVKSLREEHDFPIFLNADHTHSLASAMEAAKAGVDWIVFDVFTNENSGRNIKGNSNRDSCGRRDWRHWQRFRDPRCCARPT